MWTHDPGFAGCAFRFLTQFTEEKKRVRWPSLTLSCLLLLVRLHIQSLIVALVLQILCLQLLVLLAEDNADAVVRSCQIAAQGQHWQPNMFIYTLQKRHSTNETICALVAELLESFAERMPITSPIQLGSPRSARSPRGEHEAFVIQDSDSRRLDSPQKRAHALPSLGSPKPPPVNRSPVRTPHSPMTTMSSLYIDAPSPYAPHTRLPLARPPTSPLEQSRRSRIFSTPKLAAVDGETHRRCQTPNAKDFGRPSHLQLAGLASDDASGNSDGAPPQPRSPDLFEGSPPKSPDGESPKKRVVLSEKYSWNPECINSVSGFEWWWRSLPQNHGSLEPTQKLKMVTKAAVRLHTKGDWQRAIELYLLALSMEINDEVAFRLRINLACAYEAAQELRASIEAFRAALELNDTDPYAQFKLGEVLGASGEFEEARRLFEGVMSAYPQAADALKKLDQAEERMRQEDEAKREATAKAKLRRSPSKKKRAHKLSDGATDVNDESANGETPHPTSPLSSPRVTRKAKKSSERNKTEAAAAPLASDSNAESPAEPVPTSDSDTREHMTSAQEEQPADVAIAAASVAMATEPTSPRSTVSVGTMAEVATASVDTMTDGDSDAALLDLLVERCVALGIDLQRYVAQLDVHQSGRVRLESLAEVVRILCSVDFTSLSTDTMARELQLALPVDVARDDDGTQVFVHYARLLTAADAKTTRDRDSLRGIDAAAVRSSLDALALAEARLFVRHTAEASALEWISRGMQRALTSERDASAYRDRTLVPDEAGHSRAEGPRCADVEAHEAPAATNSLDDSTELAQVDQECELGENDNADECVDEEDEEVDSLGGIAPLQDASSFAGIDGYTALSPRADTKRDHARRETILRREQSRIFARKHLHCLRALRALAVHARKHHAARCEARAFLTQVAAAARARTTMTDQTAAASDTRSNDAAELKREDLSDTVAVHEPGCMEEREQSACAESGAGSGTVPPDALPAATSRLALELELEHPPREVLAAVSHTAVAVAARTAIARVVLARELALLQSLAQRFAAHVDASVIEVSSLESSSATAAKEGDDDDTPGEIPTVTPIQETQSAVTINAAADVAVMSEAETALIEAQEAQVEATTQQT